MTKAINQFEVKPTPLKKVEESQINKPQAVEGEKPLNANKRDSSPDDKSPSSPPKKRKNVSAKKRGYETCGFLIKSDNRSKFDDLRHALKDEHGQKAGVILINRALELLFKEEKETLQKYYKEKLSDI